MVRRADDLERRLHLEREVRRRLDRLVVLLVADDLGADVALADPEIVVARDHVRGGAPDQRAVLVDDARVDGADASRRRPAAPRTR